MTVVVGLDLSLTGTGIAVACPGETPTVTTITTKGRADATLLERRARLGEIGERITAHLVERGLYRGVVPIPDALVVVEAPAFSRTTGHQHDRSGLWWHVVWGYAACWPLAEVSPTTRARYATGVGGGKGASKDAVLAAVVRRYPNVPVSNNNEADALVLAAMGARHAGHPIDTPPKTHLPALDAVRWPNLEGLRP